jgi:peptidoglycan/LPS O-acetylase OafA/YrhL
MSDKKIRRFFALFILSLIVVILCGLFDGWMTYYWDDKSVFILLLATFLTFTFLIILLTDFLIWNRKISITKKAAVTSISLLFGIIAGFAYQNSMKHANWDSEEALIVSIIFVLISILSRLVIKNEKSIIETKEIQVLKRKLEIQKLENEIKKLKK